VLYRALMHDPRTKRKSSSKAQYRAIYATTYPIDACTLPLPNGALPDTLPIVVPRAVSTHQPWLHAPGWACGALKKVIPFKNTELSISCLCSALATMLLCTPAVLRGMTCSDMITG
jgi:hypothetical protein